MRVEVAFHLADGAGESGLLGRGVPRRLRRHVGQLGASDPRVNPQRDQRHGESGEGDGAGSGDRGVDGRRFGGRDGEQTPPGLRLRRLGLIRGDCAARHFGVDLGDLGAVKGDIRRIFARRRRRAGKRPQHAQHGHAG